MSQLMHKKFVAYGQGTTANLTREERVLFTIVKTYSEEGSLTTGWTKATPHEKGVVLSDVLGTLDDNVMMAHPSEILDNVTLHLREGGAISSLSKQPQKPAALLTLHQKILAAKQALEN